MGTQVGIGISQHRNPKAAAQTAVAAALAQADITQPSFVFLFATVGYKQKLLVETVRAATGNAPLFGCSAAGVIAQGVADESNFAVVVMVVGSHELRFHHGVISGLSESSLVVGQSLGQAIDQVAGDDAIALFLNPDGMTVNVDDLMAGLAQTTQRQTPLPIIGGLCGDNFVYQKTYQYCDSDVISDGVSWALLSGNATIITDISHGCVPIGQTRTITRSDGNKIYEIDHRPVLDVLQEYLEADEIANWERAAVNLGLGFIPTDAISYGNNRGDDILIRCMLSKDDAIGSVAASANVAEGSKFWITRRDPERMYQAAEKTAVDLHTALNGQKPKFIFHTECDGRGKLVMAEKDKYAMISIMQMILGTDIPWIGLYAYGELCPINGHNYLHSFTGALSAIC